MAESVCLYCNGQRPGDQITTGSNRCSTLQHSRIIGGVIIISPRFFATAVL